MITFTKEQLIASAHARIEFAEMMLAGELEPLKERTWSIELEMARIALASLEAEPVAWLWSHRKHPSEVTLVRPEDDERAEGAHWSGWSCQALYAEPVTTGYKLPEGWVACSERMPEREIDVQVYCSDKKEQMVGYMERNELDGYFRFASLPNGGGVYCQPTHWMPLPAAPQQEVK
jgi:Protein of unknown function (DUF551).